MNEQFFLGQVGRLRTRFGDKSFDGEFVKLIAREVHDMSEHAFQRFVDVMIGSRTAHKPPLLSEFREARMTDDKRRFDNEVNGAASAMNWPAAGGLQRFLAREYPGAKTLNDAVDIQRLRNRIAEADGNNPDDSGPGAA